MLVLTWVESYSFRVMLLPWCYWLIMIVQLIEEVQVVIPTGAMIKGSKTFYWILLKKTCIICF